VVGDQKLRDGVLKANIACVRADAMLAKNTSSESATDAKDDADMVMTKALQALLAPRQQGDLYHATAEEMAFTRSMGKTTFLEAMAESLKTQREKESTYYLSLFQQKLEAERPAKEENERAEKEAREEAKEEAKEDRRVEKAASVEAVVHDSAKEEKDRAYLNQRAKEARRRAMEEALATGDEKDRAMLKEVKENGEHHEAFVRDQEMKEREKTGPETKKRRLMYTQRSADPPPPCPPATAATVAPAPAAPAPEQLPPMHMHQHPQWEDVELQFAAAAAAGAAAGLQQQQ
jgi:hypothetical protein